MKKLYQLLTNIYSSLQRIICILSSDRPHVLSVEQLSEYLSFSTSTIYKYCCERKIPYRKIGRNTIFLRSEIDEWLLKSSYSVATLDEIENSAKEYVANN